MASLQSILFAGTLAAAASTGQAGPDDSVWYQPSTPSAPTTPAPSNPNTPSASNPHPAQTSVVSGSTVSIGVSASSYPLGDFYYPSGTGYPTIHPYYYRRRGWGYYGRYYWPDYYRYYRTYDTPDTSTLIELARRYDPQLIGVDPNAEPPTDRELGEQAMKKADYDTAITHFAVASDEQKREATDQPNRQAQRLLGMAYAANRQFDLAGQQLVEAFETDSSLRTLPIRGEDLFKDGLELNSVVSRAVGYAHRNPSYESWFTVAVLMQAQGKNDLANDMIKRAEAAKAAGNQTTPAAAPPPATPETTKPTPKSDPETEAERLRRELRESTERLEETKRRLEEIRRKKAAEEADA